MAVHPRVQGRRLGRLVVAEALRDLVKAGCEEAELYVDTDDTAARKLYAWAGFTMGIEHHCLELTVPPSMAR